MNTLFNFEDQPQEHKPLVDWSGKEIPIKKPIESDNPMVVAHGKGIVGKKCRDCKFLIRLYHHNQTYLKCEKRGITHGKGTDHRAKWEACSKFEQAEPEVKEEEPVESILQPYSDVCPQCKGEIRVLYSWGIWACSTCKIKISQTKERGITKIEPLAVFRIAKI